MGLFGKKKKLERFDDGHNHNLFTDDDDFVLPIEDSPFGPGAKHRAAAPHALTADEVTGNTTPEIIVMENGTQPKAHSVYERIKEQRRKEEEDKYFEDDYVPSWATAAVKKTAEATGEQSSPAAEYKAPEPKTPAPEPKKEVPTAKTPVPEPKKEEPVARNEHDDFLEKCRMAVDLATGGTHHDSKALETFTGNGDFYYKPMDTKAAAIKVDVEDIIRRLKTENKLPVSAAAAEAPAKETAPSPADGIMKDVSARTPTAAEESFAARPNEPAAAAEVTPEEIPMKKAAAEPAPNNKKLAAFEDDEDVIIYRSRSDADEPTDDAAEGDSPKEVKVQVEVIPPDSDSDIMHTDSVAGAQKTYGKVYRGVVMGRSEKGDVQLERVIDAAKESASAAAAAAGAAGAVAADAADRTMIFGGVGDVGSAVSSRADDELDDFSDLYDHDDETYDVSYYESEPKEVRGIDDYNDLNDSARLRTKLMSEQATRFTFTVLSFITTVLIAVASSPLSTLIGTTAVGFINLLLLAATILFNLNIFADLKRLAGFNIGFDTCVSLAAIVMLIQNIVSVTAADGKYSAVSGAATLLLAINSLAKTLKLKRTLKGLETIATSRPKNAVTAAAGTPAATIASGAVDGEVIALSGRETVNVRGYLKNCGYLSPFDLKAKVLLIAGICAALAIGLAAGFLADALTGLTLAALTLCCCFPACAALTAELPMYLASTRLSRYGAMLAGFKGAYDLNLSNVLAVKTSDLFPEGSITLYDMKPLGKNEVGRSLVDAAAVAIAAHSPLAPIFTGIIGSVPEKDMPDITGVQYEDKMGITGWIGERTILIGNRNLMQGHNVAVPPSSVDQKILRAGYFPVYIACDGVPCLLFIVKYEADENIAAELRRVCSTGMTVVVYPEDPNASDMMLCDYFGLPNDAIKVMRHNGRVAYERATVATESTTAPASYGRSVCGFFSAVSAAINLKSTITVLTVLYVIAAVLACVLLLYLTMTGKLALVTSFSFILFEAVFVLLSAAFSRMVRR